MRLIIFLLLSFVASHLYASEAKMESDSIPWLEWDFAAGSTHIAPLEFIQPKQSGRAILLPAVIQDIRERTWPGYDADSALDNPLRHNALFVHLHAKAKITKGIYFNIALLGEHRGFSYGVFNTENSILFPQARLTYNRTFKILKQDFRFFGNLGYFPNDQLYEGLCIYNIDAQGIDFHVKYKKWHFQYHQINDLLNGVGLRIDDSYDYVFGLDSLNIGNSWIADFKVGIFRGTTNWPDYQGTKAAFGFYNINGTRIYGQMALRVPFPTEIIVGDIDLYAGLLGLKSDKVCGNFSLRSKIEVRFYGGGFNEGFKNSSFSYRQSRSSNTYGGTIGNILYPLHFYDRPLSQWGLFTEYQDGLFVQNPTYRKKWVGGITTQVESKYRFPNGIRFSLDLDFNYLFSEDADPFFYPFYTFGFGWEPIADNYFLLILTNRGMNLDVNYSTLYLYQKPHAGLKFRRAI